ncbi:MAG TPA: hypothetical protein VKA88_08520 [Solirubrobacterales bacterium]|nr:hypothetical protein [Solirubrobacterales bacterium]
MQEILPGVWHWTATHPNTGSTISSYWVPPSRAVIDALLPDEGIDAFADDPPERVLLSNRHHLRHAERFAERFGSSIACSAPGMHEFEGGPPVESFDFGDEVAPGIDAFEVGAICPDESALLIHEARALSIADGIRHYDGRMDFFSDSLLGDDPEGVKSGLRRSYAGLLDLDFDSLLFAHGDPIVGGGKNALREFADGGM